MNNNMIKYSLTIILLIGTVSCDEWGEKFFDDTLVATDNLNPDFSSNYDFEGILNGAYFTMKANGQFGIVDAEPALRVIVSDLVQRAEFSNTQVSVDIQQVYNRSTNDADIEFLDWIWRSGYMVLQGANKVLDFYKNNEPFEDDLNTTENINRMVGEAHFMRAFAHLRLVKTFAPPFSANPSAPGIILQLTPPIDAQDLASPATVEQTYESIIDDLEIAISLLPMEFNGNLHPEAFAVRANQNVAKSLLAQVYFLMGEQYWGNLSDSYSAGKSTSLGLINDVLNLGKYDLNEDLTETWSQIGEPFNKAQETIWAEDYFRTWRGNRLGRFFTKQETGGARFMRQFPMSDAIVQKIGWEDESAASMDKRYRQWFRRFVPSPATEEETDPEFSGEYTKPLIWAWKGNSLTINIPILRSAELYLMRAAILVKSGGDKIQAMADLNKTRVRAELDPITDASSLTLEDVEIEWIKELSFEGSRLTFLQAMKMDVGPGGRAEATVVPYDSPSLYFSFPRREVELNPNL